MISQTKKAATTNKCASIIGHFDGHDDALMRRCGAERITQQSMSRATLDASGCRHLAIICPVLPRRTPWSLILA